MKYTAETCVFTHKDGKVCGEKGYVWGGHLHKGKDTVTAVLCETHQNDKSENKECMGCYGELNPKTVIKESLFGVGYIDEDGFHKDGL